MGKRIALIHDWLTGMRGGEKVLEVLCELFPQADLYTLVHVPGKVSPLIESRRIVTSYLQKIPGIAQRYRHFLPLMPGAIESFNFTDYDLMISTSHCVAKSAIPGPHTRHLSYCHTPMRYIWDQFGEYFSWQRANPAVALAMRAVRPWLQRWDRRTAARVHTFYANSENVKERIHRLYHREAEVIYPPVDTEYFAQSEAVGDRETPPPFYLIVSALAPYKRIDLAIEAFNRLEKRLLIIGEGPDYQRLRAIAKPNIHFSGWSSNDQLRWHYRRCQALIFPGEEDFGIVPVEAMASGRPVVAYAKGGALETVVEGKTGVFFPAQSADSLLQALQRLDSKEWNIKEIQQHAERFSRARCKQAFRQAFVEYAAEMS
jgi:glycosyltransferase involved in cell wall biosynthesis